MKLICWVCMPQRGSEGEVKRGSDRRAAGGWRNRGETRVADLRWDKFVGNGSRRFRHIDVA